MSHTLEEPMIRTNAVHRCATEMMQQVASVGTTLLGDMQAILHSSLGTADPMQVEFEESSLLVRSIINAEIAPHLRETRSAVIAWLCGAPLNDS